MDYEIQYRDTLDYVNRTLAANADILDVYRVCIPFKVQTLSLIHISPPIPRASKFSERKG